MAGDVVEPPFRLNFQLDSLHSGSVSFGRFENEGLCWERRSSFSHNRYREEIEKYSRPGSVTEKTAYFEAQFRKRAFVKQTPSRSQNGTEHQCRENDTLENVNYENDFGSFRKGNSSAKSDEGCVGSTSKREFEEPECAREYSGTSYSKPQHESAYISLNVVDDGVCDSEQVGSQETYQAEVENLPLIDNEPGNGLTENLSAKPRTSDMKSKADDDLSASDPPADGSVSSEHQDGPSDQKASENKQMKSKMKSQVTGAQGKRNTSNGESKDFASKLSRTKTDIPLRSKREKLVPETPSITSTSYRMQKSEVRLNSKTKAHHMNKSAGTKSEQRNINSLRPASEKVAPKTNSGANWPKRAVSSTRPGTKQNGSAFSFNSYEQAGKKKEGNMLAKEDEMDQLLEKKQEKSEDKIKHVRRSLNFEPPPMNSFYCKAGCDTDKTEGTSDRKSSKPRNKSSSSGIRTGVRSLSCQQAGSEKPPSAVEPSNDGGPLHDSEATGFPQTVPTKSRAASAAPGASRPAQARAMNLMTRKKEQHKETYKNLQKYKVSEGNKIIKGQKIEGKPKMSPGRSSTRLGHLAAGVAS